MIGCVPIENVFDTILFFFLLMRLGKHACRLKHNATSITNNSHFDLKLNDTKIQKKKNLRKMVSVCERKTKYLKKKILCDDM